MRHSAVPLIGLSAIAGACAAATSPFHGLTHEFSLLYTAVFASMAYFSAGRWAGSRREEDGSALSAIVLVGLAAFLGAVLVLVILAVVNRLVWHCVIEDGLPFFWFTWAPAAFLAIVLGGVLGARGWGLFSRVLVFVGLALFCAAHDGAQLYFGPRVYPVDLLLGDLNVLSQRSTEKLTEVHFLHRLFLVTVTLWLWPFLNSGRSEDRTMRRWLHRFVGVALLVVVAIWGSYFGVGIGRGNLDRAYPFRESHGSIRLHHSGSASALARVDAVAREAQWDHQLISQTWGLDAPPSVDVYVLESSEELARYTGIRFAHAGLGEVFVSLDDAVGETLRHEMVHALHDELDPDPRILLSRGYLEGMAMAFANYYALSPDAHDVEAAALRDGNLPSAASLVSPFGFRSVAEHSAYSSAGSFLGFLVLTYGMETFAEFQRSLDFEKVYGKSVDALDDEWRGFLGEVTVPAESAMEAGFLYDTTLHPGYAGMACPKFGAIPNPLEEEAEGLRLRGEFDVAAERYLELYESTAEVSWARWAVRCFEEVAKYDDALRVLDGAEDEEVRPSERAALVADRIRLLLRSSDWDALYAAYDARAESGLPLPLGNRMGEACLRNLAIRDAYAAALFEGDPYHRGRLWREMLDAQPEFEPLRYTYAVAGQSFQSALSSRVDAMLAASAISSEFADSLAPQILALYNEAMGERAYALAESLSRALLNHCGRSGNQLLGEMGMARIEWERSLDPAATSK